MNKFYSIVFSFIAFLFIANTAFGQSYCTPPKYYSGPYTGIIKVELGTVSKSSQISDGYSDFTTSVQMIELKKGSEATINLDLFYEPSMLSYFQGNLNLRVWIDWNQNFVFDEPAETAVSAMQNCKSTPTLTKFSAKFTVPADAKSGKTRMRVFNDMAETDGHITPKPCGYLNSSNQLGQHGECEDYSVNISDETYVPEELKGNELNINIYPNPVYDKLSISEFMFGQIDFEIYNNLGLKVHSGILSNEIVVSFLPSGIYFLKLNNHKLVKFLKL